MFSTNEAHRWHHSSDAAEADANFGSALLLWDHVFGTYRAAAVDQAPAAIGLFADAGRYPSQQTYGRQLASMFSAGCCRA